MHDILCVYMCTICMFTCLPYKYAHMEIVVAFFVVKKISFLIVAS